MQDDYIFDAIVVGAGHAGIEAGLALARLKSKTLMLAISLDSVGALACNPSIGGTAKGHLVREIDALGGQMGLAADTTLTQLRMLNMSKGFAVRSLRAQVDKYKYHDYMKSVLENTPNLHLRQGEAVEILRITNGKILDATKFKADVEIPGGYNGYLVKTRCLTYLARAVIVCSGVYLKSKIFIGDSVEERGPGYTRSELLSDSLLRLGLKLRRFKTGTPARVKKSTINLSVLEVQEGSKEIYSFSDLSTRTNYNAAVCYLGWTNQNTHKIIRDNLHLSPRKIGLTAGTGARYCPSIEDKVERFDRDRHQFFLEPEGDKTQEMYVQGISSSLPAAVQLQLYRSIVGFENVEIMRDAYAIEYDCIDPSALSLTLMHKANPGLFFAGQINGTSGYEEAAAQGIVAGINAARFLLGKDGVVFTRDCSYIGVLIDDIVTKGTDEPYRMMTSRAEFRLLLRQDNADLRLTQLGRDVGLVTDGRYNRYRKKLRDIKKLQSLLDCRAVDLGLSIKTDNNINEVNDSNDIADNSDNIAANAVNSDAVTLRMAIKRGLIESEDILALPRFARLCKTAALDVFIGERYSGYLIREERARKEVKRLESMLIPEDFDFPSLKGISREAAEKLAAARPRSVGQAGRLSGVNPADVNVLIFALTIYSKKGDPTL